MPTSITQESRPQDRRDNVTELEDAVGAAARENVGTRDAFRQGSLEAYRRPGSDGSARDGTLEAIQQDWLRTLAELERSFDAHRKRLDSYAGGVRAALDEMKRLGT